MFRQTAVAVFRNQTRLFATTPALGKGPIEGAKDAVKSVDRAVSDAAVAGIEKGQEAKESLKSSVGMDKGKASEIAGEAKGKAQELAGEAKGKAQEIKGEAKGKAEEVKGKM